MIPIRIPLAIAAVAVLAQPSAAQTVRDFFAMASCQNGADGLRPSARARFVVDDRNGYLTAADTSAGQISTHAFTYFNVSDGDRLFACTEEVVTEDEHSFRLSFYRMDAGRMTRISDRVVPALDLEDFTREGTLPPPKRHRLIDLRYTLPRSGTTIVVEPVALQDLGAAVQDRLDPNIELSSAELETYQRLVSGSHYRAIELVWDRDHGIFSIGRKIPR